MTSSPVVTDPRIETARTRRMLEDTALAAVPGTLLALTADHGAQHRWTAEVRSTSGEHLTLSLDRSLQTVEVAPLRAMSRAA